MPQRPRSCTVVSSPGLSTCSAPIVCPRHAGDEAHEIAGCEQTGWLAIGVEHHRVGAADQLPAAGTVHRINAGLPAGDADRPAATRSRGTRWRGAAMLGSRDPCTQTPAQSRACRRDTVRPEWRAITSCSRAARESRPPRQIRATRRRRSAPGSRSTGRAAMPSIASTARTLSLESHVRARPGRFAADRNGRRPCSSPAPHRGHLERRRARRRAASSNGALVHDRIDRGFELDEQHRFPALADLHARAASAATSF